MSEKVNVWSDAVAQPFGHYSQAIKMGRMVYISGQLPLDPKTGKPIGGDTEAQVRQVFENMSAILVSCGGQLSSLLTTTLYLVDLRDFPIFDKISKDYFYHLPPARTTIGVNSLPGGCRVCLDGIAELTIGGGGDQHSPSMI